MSESDTQGTTTVTEPKRGRRTGGRERRDPNAKVTGPAYIKRVIPAYDIMGEKPLRLPG